MGNPPPGAVSHRHVAHKNPSGDSDCSNSPPNIAPQHMFDGVSLTENAFQSPVLSHLRNPSPGSTSSFNERNLEAPQTYEGLLQANTALKTRVSELEVINELYRGTVNQYEQGGASQGETVSRDSDGQLRQLLDQSHRREQELRQKLLELEHEIADLRDEQRPSKRARISNPPEYPEPPQISLANGLDS